MHIYCAQIIKIIIIEVENLKPSPNCAYKWFYGMLIHYTLQKITMGHKKWTTIACIHLGINTHQDVKVLHQKVDDLIQQWPQARRL